MNIHQDEAEVDISQCSLSLRRIKNYCYITSSLSSILLEFQNTASEFIFIAFGDCFHWYSCLLNPLVLCRVIAFHTQLFLALDICATKMLKLSAGDAADPVLRLHSVTVSRLPTRRRSGFNITTDHCYHFSSADEIN